MVALFILSGLAGLALLAYISWIRGWKYYSLVPGVIVITTVMLNYLAGQHSPKLVGFIVAAGYIISFLSLFFTPQYLKKDFSWSKKK